MEQFLVIALTAAFGLAFGSFATVLEARIPNGPSIVSGGSVCPNCGVGIKPWHNIPVIGYLVLGGKCANCKAKISPKYPATEIITVLLFVASVLSYGLSFSALAMCAFAVVTMPLLLIDLRLQRLPNKLTYSLALTGLVVALAQYIATGDAGHLLAAILSGLIPFVAFFLLALFSGGGMGLGDVKLAGGLGLALGVTAWQSSFAAFVIAFLLGGVVAAALLVLRRAGRKHQIPFGPYLIAGAWISYLGGPILQQALLSLWIR
jgi:leader peptidase (prepilin peptidase)/N-methyltransferase